MKNFEQIRAKNALEWKDKIGKGADGGESVAKKVPAMILDNGIIAAAAFALEKRSGYENVFERSGYENVFEAVIAHLSDSEIGLFDGANSLEKFVNHLANVPSDELRRITAETAAFLNYLRRFA